MPAQVVTPVSVTCTVPSDRCRDAEAVADGFEQVGILRNDGDHRFLSSEVAIGRDEAHHIRDRRGPPGLCAIVSRPEAFDARTSRTNRNFEPA